MQKRIYLDYAASTPVDPRVERAMRPYFSAKFGNPGSLHSYGQEAIAAVDAARERIAGTLSADFREVMFTGSATEANNLALRGALRTWRRDPKHADIRPRIAVSAIEHESILETARDLERDGVEVVYLAVDKEGYVDVAALASLFDGRTAVISVMYGNNETGTVQPVAAMADMVRAKRADDPWPLFHTDAAQTFAFLDCGTQRLRADMTTISAHKLYGPKGIGALYVRKGTPLAPFITGGGQEFGFRSGTENVPLIAGFAQAADIAVRIREKEAKRLSSLREYCITGIKRILSDAEVNGPSGKQGKAGLPHIVNVRLPGISAEDAIIKLDLAGIAASSGSACRARAIEPSHVLLAMGRSRAQASESIRLSFGRGTTKAEIGKFLAALKLFR